MRPRLSDPRPTLTVGLLAAGLLLAGCSSGTPAGREDDAARDLFGGASASASASAPPEGPVFTENLSNDHEQGRLSFAQSPPVGGPHNARWIACGVYDVVPPSELAVHSLEHGAVWLAHRPDADPADVQALVALAETSDTTRQYTLVTPYDGLTAPVTAIAWGVTLSVDSATDPRLAEFVDVYAGGGQGGEPGAPCADGGLTPQDGQALLDSEG